LGKLGPVWLEALRAAGADAVGLDLRDGEAAGCAVYEGDVTDRAALDEARARIETEHGTPWILVNNAGIDQPPDAAARTYAIEDLPLDDFRRTVEVNLTGAFNALQAFGPPMRDAGRGAIVNIGSLYATVAAEPRFYDHFDAD